MFGRSTRGRSMPRAGRGAVLIFGACVALASMAQTAQACMGVKRTITVNSFKSSMGTGRTGGIGLRRGEVVLTFDDGPRSGPTASILKTLRANCVKATFFVEGGMARANARLLRSIARSGHTIAHHTHGHGNLARMSAARAAGQIDRGVASVHRALGGMRRRASRLFRYPYLARSRRLDAMLRKRGLLPFSAGILSNDWRGGSSATIVNRIMDQLKRRGSGVILMHDIHSRTARALPLLLKRLRAGGYRIVHVRGRGSAPAPRSTGPVVAAKTTRLNRSRKVAALSSHSHAAKRVAKAKPRRRSLFAVLFGRRTDAVTTGSVRKPKRKAAKRAGKRKTPHRGKRRAAKRERRSIFAIWRERRTKRTTSRRRTVRGASAKLRSRSRTALSRSRKPARRSVMQLESPLAVKAVTDTDLFAQAADALEAERSGEGDLEARLTPAE